MRRLYVRNIPFGASDDDLRAFLREEGFSPTEVKIVRETDGRSRGFGFVTLASDEEGKRCIDECSGASLDGRPIYFAEARRQEPENRRQGGSAPREPKRSSGSDRSSVRRRQSKPGRGRRSGGNDFDYEG